MAMQQRGLGLHNALIIGYDDESLKVFHRFKGFPELGYVIKGVIRTDGEFAHEQTANLGPVIPLPKLPWRVEEEEIDRIFIPSPKFVNNGFAPLVDFCRTRQIKLKILSPEADQLLRTANVYDIAGISLYSPPRSRIDAVRRIVKRGFDIVCSLLLIVVSSPIFFVNLRGNCS